jgi:hypothetical protein
LTLCACSQEISTSAQQSAQPQAPTPQITSTPRQSALQQEKLSFNEIFQNNANGSISPRATVAINGVTMTPGVTFGEGVLFGGIDLGAMKSKTFFVARQDNVIVIKGISQ